MFVMPFKELNVMQPSAAEVERMPDHSAIGIAHWAKSCKETRFFSLGFA